MNKNVLKMSIATILMSNLIGCSTLYNHMNYPYTVTDDKNLYEEATNSKNNSNDTLPNSYMFCSQKIPKHSLFIMIPIVGPVVDALMISNKDWIKGKDFAISSLLPILGGLHTYLDDTQCIFNSFYLKAYEINVARGIGATTYEEEKSKIDKLFAKPNKAIHHAFVNQVINQSDKNCNKYQTLIKSAKGEFSLTVNSVETLGSAASGIAGVAGDGATSGGFSAANILMKGLSNDIDKIIYNGNDLDLIFKTANSSRQMLKKCFYNHETKECKIYKDWHMQKVDPKENCKVETRQTNKTKTSVTNNTETDETSKTEINKTKKIETSKNCTVQADEPSGVTWIEQSEFIDFMNAYDRACFLPQAKISSQDRLDTANEMLKSGDDSSDSLQKQNSSNTK